MSPRGPSDKQLKPPPHLQWQTPVRSLADRVISEASSVGHSTSNRTATRHEYSNPEWRHPEFLVMLASVRCISYVELWGRVSDFRLFLQ